MCSAVLSIDGGGTKTAALVAGRDGTVRKLKPASGCNPQDGAGWQEALRAIFAQAGDIDLAVIGMPGFGEVPDDDARVSAFIAANVDAKHMIINDVELAFRGAFPVGDGTLLLAGTGSMAISQIDGVMRRSGGWGHWIGDEGSAFWIGQQALSRAAAEKDGRVPSKGFATRLADALKAPDHPFGLLDWAMQSDERRARIASVARVVDRLAQAGDPIAGVILDDAATHLGALVRSVSHDGIPWACAGSVLNSTRIIDNLTLALGPATPPVASALVGGLSFAATLAEWNVTQDWTDRVAGQANDL